MTRKLKKSENDVFLAFVLGMCDGVGEDLRHRFGHVDCKAREIPIFEKRAKS